MEGLIILIATLVGFLGLGIYIIVMIAKGPKLPKGYKIKAKFGGNKATLIVDKEIPTIKDKDSGKVVAWLIGGKRVDGSELAEKCATAIATTEAAFKRKGVQKADVDHVVFYYQTDDNFETGTASWWEAWAKDKAAYSTTINGMFGSNKTPMAVMRSKYMTTTVERAQPAIHELVHILNKAAGGDYSHKHTDPVLWLGPGGVDSAEGIAVEQWADLVEAFNED